MPIKDLPTDLFSDHAGKCTEVAAGGLPLLKPNLHRCSDVGIFGVEIGIVVQPQGGYEGWSKRQKDFYKTERSPNFSL